MTVILVPETRMPSMDEFRRRLEAQREKVLATARERDEAGETVELDQQRVGRLSRMDAMQMQAMARAEAGRAKAQLRAIDAALARIESGAYGECIDCADAIATARLEVNPAAERCIACAEKAG